MRPLIAFCIVAASIGCGNREPLPASHAQPERNSLGSSDSLADDPIRQELRALHAACDETVAALEQGVADEVRRENILTAVAVLAYVVGEIADGRDPEIHNYGPGGTGECAPTVEGGEGPGCNPQPYPSTSLGEGGPIDQRADEAHLDAGDQIRQINHGLDAIDELVFSNPDPSTWNDEHERRWQQLSRTLGSACGQ